MKKLLEKLSQRKESGNLRSLQLQHGLIDFFSNDYLGLAKSKALSEAISLEHNSLKGNINGATGSRLLSGNNEYTVIVEKQLSKIFKAEKALIFNSGYSANLSILSSVPQKGDTIIYDELIHASLKEGARLSFANRYSFRHNNLEELEHKIQKATGDCYVVIESVYSMDGDFSPLAQIVSLCDKYKANLILDEAHSTGIWGEGGNGLACELGVEDKIFARVYTFGKAMGIHGACIAGSEILIDYLVNFSRPFIYTTALPPHSIACIKTAFEYLKNNPHLSGDLLEKINYFKSEYEKSFGLDSILGDSNSPIQVLKVPGNINARALASKLNNNGYDVRAILSPTVKEGEERLRICLHVYNTEQEIIKLIELLK